MADGIKQCNAFSGIDRDYCIALSQSCIEQGEEGKSPIVLDLRNGNTEQFQGTSQCLSFAKFRASLGAPKGFSATPPPKKAPPPAPAPPGEKKDKTQPKKNKGGKAGAKKTDTKKTVPSNGAAFSKCSEAGPKLSPEYEYCKQLIEICTAGDGPYRLPFQGKETEVRGQRECLGLALYYSRMSGGGLGSGRGTPRPDVSGGSWQPDGKTRFAATFYDVGFQPEVSDRIQLKPLTLLYNYDSSVRGIEATIAYRLERNDEGTCTIRYHVYRERAPKLEDLSGSDLDMSFTFKTDGNTIAGTLAFGVILYNEGDFGSPSSIEIVKLN